jgi:putative flavoprotein involved in K+ transport
MLFERATARFKALHEGRILESSGGLGDIVTMPPVRVARERGVLHSVQPFDSFTPDGVIWPDGCETPVDTVIWCTGFRSALDYLAPLGVIEPDGRIAVTGTRSVREPRLWLVDYGEWTGFASATMISAGRTARSTVAEINTQLHSENR